VVQRDFVCPVDHGDRKRYPAGDTRAHSDSYAAPCSCSHAHTYLYSQSHADSDGNGYTYTYFRPDAGPHTASYSCSNPDVDPRAHDDACASALYSTRSDNYLDFDAPACPDHFYRTAAAYACDDNIDRIAGHRRAASCRPARND
jgi:hypothetical protein